MLYFWQPVSSFIHRACMNREQGQSIFQLVWLLFCPIQFVDTVVMCSSVISSRTPHRISTTWTDINYFHNLECFSFQFGKSVKNSKCPNLVLQSVLLTAILLDLGVDVFHQRVPLHQHVSEGGTGEDTHHLRTDQWRVEKGKILKKEKTFELRGGNPSKLWKVKVKRKILNKERPLSWEVATRPNFQQIFCQPSPHLGALPLLQKYEPFFPKVFDMHSKVALCWWLAID